jgi:hypothetical protein
MSVAKAQQQKNAAAAYTKSIDILNSYNIEYEK